MYFWCQKVYSPLNLTRGASAETYWYVAFDTSAIPQNATITSCSGKSKCAISSTNSNYIKTRQVRFYSGTNPKGNATTLSTSSAVINITVGTWTRDELSDTRVRYYAQRNSGSTNSSIYIRPYGSELHVNYSWDETIYSITTSSSVQGVGISTQSGETTSGGSNVITLTGVSSLSSIKLKDNNVVVTSSLVKSGSNYTYTLNNISADHVITVEVASSPSVQSKIKKNGNFVSANKLFEKVNGGWVEKTISKLYWKLSSSWSENATNDGTIASKTHEI